MLSCSFTPLFSLYSFYSLSVECLYISLYIYISEIYIIRNLHTHSHTWHFLSCSLTLFSSLCPFHSLFVLYLHLSLSIYIYLQFCIIRSIISPSFYYYNIIPTCSICLVLYLYLSLYIYISTMLHHEKHHKPFSLLLQQSTIPACSCVCESQNSRNEDKWYR